MLAGWPELNAKPPNRRNFLAHFLLTHVYKYFPIKRAYQLEEIHPTHLDASELVNEGERLWNKYAGSKGRLWKSLGEQFAWYCFGVGFMCLGKGLGSIMLALLMKVVIKQISNGISSELIWGCVGLVVIDFIVVSCDRMYVGYSMYMAMRVRVVLTGLIYRKLMRTKIGALQFMSDGQLSNFIGADVERLFLCIIPLQYIWVSPIILVTVIFIIWAQLGAIALIGYVAVAVLFVVQTLPVRMMGSYRLKSATLGDERLSLVNEAIEAIHLIKAGTWETAIAKHIDAARWAEIKAKIIQSCCEGVKDVFSNINRLFVLLFVTAMYTIMGESIDAASIFPLSSLYSTSCTWFPNNFVWALQDIIYARVSMKRAQDFLDISDQEADLTVDLKTGVSDLGLANLYKSASSERVQIVHPTNEILVRDSLGNLIDIGANSGKLIGLAGPSASGKTTFIRELLGFKEGGSVDRIKTSDHRIGYAHQTAWIFPGTLRENILAGMPFQSQKYWDVIRACCLDEDLKNLKHGDQTRIGFGGVTLSGGQQQRTSLARAAYSGAEVFIFDDPFSAINQKIAKRIFKLLINQYLEDKTRLVVLHEDDFLSACNSTLIFPMTTAGPGSNYISATEHSHMDFSARKLNTILSESETELDVISDIDRTRRGDIATTYAQSEPEIGTHSQSAKRFRARRFQPADLAKKTNGTPLYHKFGEELAHSVSWKVYWEWCKAANWFLVLLLFLNLAAARCMVNISDLWLTSWTGDDCDEDSTIGFLNATTGECDTYSKNWYYFKHYLVLVVIALLVSFPLTMGWRICFMMGCDRIHQRMIRSTLRTPMAIINEKSIGEIYNRFSRDINGIDWVVIFMSYSFFDGFSSIISYLVVIICNNVYIAIGLVPAFVFVLIIRYYYLRCTRQMARLEAEAKSPYFTHFQTSFLGLTTARALRIESYMVTDFHRFQNVFVSVASLFLDFLLWMDLMVGYVGVFFLGVVAAACVLIVGLSDSSSTVGLVLMYTLTLLENLQKNVRESAETDNKMVHTERCLEFTHLTREEPERGNETDPKYDDEAFSNIRAFSVKNGSVLAQRVKLRYSSTSPWVLKDFNLEILPSEKIGLAGRTGCGKSSFLNVLLRMYDFEGSVLIDGSDIKALTLSSLRKGISIMTQFPILFTMTLRQNLDPNCTTKDDELWRALELVGLKDTVLQMPEGIDTKINPRNLEWSGGEKQLFCMARTMLEGRKIVLMDEPTSSLDNVTSKLLWDKCVHLLKDCTVIIVSHMPSQLTFCNRIINMDAKSDASL